MTSVIRTVGLTKSYHGRPALIDLDLEVPANVVFGYLGPNGAGKTTTIRLLAGLLRATRGRAEIFGLDTVRERERVQRRIGYLPGEFVAYPNLTGAQYLSLLSHLRGEPDLTPARALADRLDLDLTVKIGTMSHGNRQKVGLVQAFMHQPDLLILDEPTAGLDPLMQREFLALVRQARAAGKTVFLSSHILSEVEAVADVVAILRQGRLVVVQSIDKLKSLALRRIELTFAGRVPVADLRGQPAVRDLRIDGRTAYLVVEGSTAGLLLAAAPHQVDNIITHEPDLEEIFMTYYGEGAMADAAHGVSQEPV